MTAPASRYTDNDLLRTPLLVGYAIDYATEYRGSWDVMTAARDLALRDGVLPLPIARMVLNCARNDPMWQAPEIGPQFYALPHIEDGTKRDLEIGRRMWVVKPPPPPRERQPVMVRLTIKHDYAWSAHKRTKRCHLVHHEWSRGKYWPVGDQIVPRLWTWCGTIPHEPLLRVTSGIPEHLTLCPRCVTAKEETCSDE